MTSFSVDLEALEDAAAGITATMNDLQRHGAREIEAAPTMTGHAAVATALTLFGDRWQRGIENLARDAQAIAGRLSFSVQDYLASAESRSVSPPRYRQVMADPRRPSAFRQIRG